MDVLIHWGLEMSGSASIACITMGCRNAAHKHGRIVRFFADHASARWILDGLFTLATAYITVRIVG